MRRCWPPRAIVVVTAHWETDWPTLSANPAPPMIYDFGGFPEALYRISYAARGEAEVATHAMSLLRDAGMTASVDEARVFDHGTCVPMMHLFPDANVPIVQLSVQPSRGTAHHVEVGRALAPLRDEGW